MKLLDKKRKDYQEEVDDLENCIFQETGKYIKEKGGLDWEK